MRAGLLRITPLMLFLVVLAPLVFATKVEVQTATVGTGLEITYPKFLAYNSSDVIYLNWHVFNKTGFLLTNATVQCELHVYNPEGEHIVVNHNLSFNNTYDDFIQNLTGFGVGLYSYTMWCNDTKYGGFVSDSFEITASGEPRQTGEAFILGILILIPLILVIVFIVGAATLGDDHPALRIGLFLLSIIPFYWAMQLAVTIINHFFKLDELQLAMGNQVYWTSLIFFVLLMYFGIYLFYKAIHKIAQKKRERLKY